MDQSSIFQVSLEIWGIIFSLVCATSLLYSNIDHKRSTTWLSILMYITTVLLACDSMAYIFSGTALPLNYFMVRFANFMVYLSEDSLTALFGIYLYEVLKDHNTVVSKKPLYAVAIISVINFFLLVLTQFTGFYYYFDANNNYHRSSFVWITWVFMLICLCIYLVMILYYRRNLSEIACLSLLTFIIMPTGMAVLQMFMYGLSLINIGIALSLIFVFVAHMHNQTTLLRKQSMDLAHTESKLLISQIQPTFIHNSLDTIRSLISPDNTDAIETLDEFSKYLRDIANCLNYNTTIPLSYEQQIISHYIYMESKSFRERLNVIYKFEDTADYEIPPLTIQPLIENSIKYGLSPKPEGGTITIHTYSDSRNHYIEITDDGRGFDTSILETLGNENIGINNIKVRLANLCDGRLIITSKIGFGTTNIITIPIS